MALTEPGRHWTFDRNEWRFQYRFAGGLHPVLSQRIFHLNPAYVLDFAARPPDWLLMSGSWFLPTVAMSVLVSKFRPTITYFWSESNLAYVEHTSDLADNARRLIMDKFDGYVVPGQWAEEYVQAFAPSATNKPILRLPNVVDEGKFTGNVAKRRLAQTELQTKWNLASSPRPILLTVARLEPIKGIRELVLALVRTSLHRRLTLLVAGEGSLRAELEATVAQAGANNTIRFLGHLGEVEVVDLLAAADGFILPSLGDPYPLAAIEAAFASLPLLLSNRIGCHPEALVPGENGCLFDPHDIQDIKSCLDWFLNAGLPGWKAMGNASLQIAEKRFSTQRVLTNFVDQLLKL